MSEDGKVKIKDYQIHNPPIGEGSYGTVYHATYRSLSERALKVFRPGAVDIVSMARELEKLSQVAEHNGIVTLHDFDLLHDPPYYAMGLHTEKREDGTWESRTLDSRCGAVEYKEAWRLIRDIAEAVAYLHRNQIIHCDLKPSNILLTDEMPPNIKICDFGQSRGLAAESFEPVGTPLYASPEQLRSPSNSSEGKGFRWDVYSFGVIAYKLLTGDLPRLQELAAAENTCFDPDATIAEATIEATLTKSGNRLDSEYLANMIEAVEEISWPDNFYIPTAWKQLIEECLSLDPTGRPADMREVRRRIQDRDHMRAVRRARRVNIVFAILLIAAIWATGFAFYHASRAEKEREKAIKTGKQAEDLALIIVNELSQGDFEGKESDKFKLYSIITEHSEAFLENLPPDSEKTLRVSAGTASMNGRKALLDRNYDEALDQLTKSYDIFSKLDGMNARAARDLFDIGRIHEIQDNYDLAIQAFEKVKRVRKKILSSVPVIPNRVQDSARVYLKLADYYQTSSQPQKSIERLKEGLGVLDDVYKKGEDGESASSLRWSLELFYSLGSVQFRSGNLRAAQESFRSFRGRLNKLGVISKPTDRERVEQQLIDVIHFLGLIDSAQGNRSNAELLFREEIRMRQNISRMRSYDPEYKIGLANAYESAASSFDPGDLTKRTLARFYLEQAVALIESLPQEMRNSERNVSRAIKYQAQLDELQTLEDE